MYQYSKWYFDQYSYIAHINENVKRRNAEYSKLDFDLFLTILSIPAKFKHIYAIGFKAIQGRKGLI